MATENEVTNGVDLVSVEADFGDKEPCVYGPLRRANGENLARELVRGSGVLGRPRLLGLEIKSA